MARFASSSAATSAPPITETETPAASRPSNSSRCGSWPVQTTIVFDVEHDGLVVDGHMQSAVVDAFVVDSRDHSHVSLLQFRAVDPAGRLPETAADLAVLALQERDFTRWPFELNFSGATAF